MTSVQTDFLSDLAQDTHGIWEIFGYIRLHHPNLSDDEVFQEGLSILKRWWKNGWIELSKKPIQPSDIRSIDEAFTLMNKLKAKATKYFQNAPSIDITTTGMQEFNRQSGAA
jgi:hypothetical protein